MNPSRPRPTRSVRGPVRDVRGSDPDVRFRNATSGVDIPFVVLWLELPLADVPRLQSEGLICDGKTLLAVAMLGALEAPC